jgi:hypothetical protein
MARSWYAKQIAPNQNNQLLLRKYLRSPKKNSTFAPDFAIGIIFLYKH